MRNRIFIFKILFVDKRNFEFGKKRFIGKKAKNVTYLRILRSRNLPWERLDIHHNRCFERFLLSRFTKRISIDSFEYLLVVFHKCRNVFANFTTFSKWKHHVSRNFDNHFHHIWPCCATWQNYVQLTWIIGAISLAQLTSRFVDVRSCFVSETLRTNKVNKSSILNITDNWTSEQEIDDSSHEEVVYDIDESNEFC